MEEARAAHQGGFYGEVRGRIKGIRCWKCNKLIAEKLDGRIEFTCPRCGQAQALDKRGIRP